MILRLIYLAAGLLLAGTAVARQPNIVLFFADDFGWVETGYNGNTFNLTPNIDAFARRGVVFENAYSYPTCAPARACLITGRNTPYHGIYRVEAYKPTPEPFKKIRDERSGLFYEGDSPTIGELMKQAGYVCGYVGKWHMGDREETLPQGRGFDFNAGGYKFGAPPSYFSPYGNPQLPDGPVGEYLPERLTQESISFIQRNRDRPFFLIHAPYLVHRPVQPKPEYVELFRSRVQSEFDRPDYAAMVYALDVEFGKLLQALKDEGVYDNTLIVLLSDNGPNPVCTTGGPLRGCKASVYEGGIRVPMIAYQHGLTQASVCPEPVSVLDVLPTFLDAAGAFTTGLTLDGESLLPLLGGGSLQRDALFWHHPCYTIPTVFKPGVRDNYAYWNDGEVFMPPDDKKGDWVRPCSIIRSGEYKLIREYESDTVELYNLLSDPGEQRDVADLFPEKKTELLDQLELWLSQTSAAIPVELNPDFDPQFRMVPEAQPSDSDGR